MSSRRIDVSTTLQPEQTDLKGMCALSYFSAILKKGLNFPEFSLAYPPKRKSKSCLALRCL